MRDLFDRFRGVVAGEKVADSSFLTVDAALVQANSGQAESITAPQIAAPSSQMGLRFSLSRCVVAAEAFADFLILLRMNHFAAYLLVVERPILPGPGFSLSAPPERLPRFDGSFIKIPALPHRRLHPNSRLQGELVAVS